MKKLMGPVAFVLMSAGLAFAGIVGPDGAKEGFAVGDSRYVNVTGDTMTGTLNGTQSTWSSIRAGEATISGTMTVQGNAFSVGGSTLVVSAGNILIGATSVVQSATENNISGLYVVGASSTNERVALVITNGTADDTTTNPSTALLFRMRSLSARKGAKIVGVREGVYNGAAGADSALAFYTASNDVWNLGLYQNQSGNVGIGTSGPQTKLHVSSGVIQVDGTGYAIGVGTSAPVGALSVVGRAGQEYVLFLASSTGNQALGVHQNGHLSYYGSMAALGTCANASIEGSDSRFRVTFSGANISCEIGFGEAFDSEPICVATGVLTDFNESPVFVTESSTGTLIIPATGAWGAGDKINVHCDGVH